MKAEGKRSSGRRKGRQMILIASRIFVASSRSVPQQVFLGGCLILDNTPSNASIIPDDADDAMRADDAKQGAENCRKRRNEEKLKRNEGTCRKLT